MSVPPSILHIDLCLLSYQIYHQSVIWPMDPWYEFLAHKGARRRDVFMSRVHARCNHGQNVFGQNGLYSGPSALRFQGGTSNTNLDPIVTNYHLINPQLPTFNHDDAVFLSMKVPDYIRDTIRRVGLCIHQQIPAANGNGQTQIVKLPKPPNVVGNDHLIAFEGGTGAYCNGPWDGANGPAWSLMGYVLKRDRAGIGNGHDIHIVFRGSRSGNALRAATQGAMSHRGNPDWVTDTDSPLTTNARVSLHGQVHQGFSRAVMTSLATVKGALVEMNTRYGVPRSITVTGHSLGAGLAVMLSSAFTMGTRRDALRGPNTPLAAWPWDEMRGYYMAQPPTGDAVFERHFNAHVAGCSPYVLGDAVVECAEKKKAHSVMGKGMALAAKGRQVTGFVKMPKPPGADGDENPHEVYLIRTALRTVHGNDHDTNATPWACYRTFRHLLDNGPFTLVATNTAAPALVDRDNLKPILQQFRFTDHVFHYLAILQDILEENAIYGVYTKEETRRQKKQATQLGLMRLSHAGQATNMTDVVTGSHHVHQQLGQAQGKGIARFLGLLTILSTFERSTVNRFLMGTFDTDQEMKKSLDMNRSGK